MLNKHANPNQFAMGLKEAPCKEPLCCLASCCCAPWGCTACWARKAVLEKYHGGLPDYTCCQGYMGDKCCCIPIPRCEGSQPALCCEGCCLPVMSISIARMHMMDSKQVRPD